MTSILHARRPRAKRFVALAMSAALTVGLTALAANPARADGPAVIHGNVTANELGGAHVAGVKVYALPYNLGWEDDEYEDEEEMLEEAPNAVTDANGDYELSIPGDYYDVVFFDPAKNFLVNFYSGNFVAGRTDYVRNVALDPAGSLAGTLKAPDGTGVANVKVEAYGVNYGPDGPESDARTDANGNFVIRGLGEGTYRLRIADTYKPRWVGGTGFDSATAYGLNADADRTGIEILNFMRGSKVFVTATSPSSGRATLSIRVRTSGSVPTGKINVKEGSKTLKSNVSLVNGVATVKLSGLRKGGHTFKVTYAGTSFVLASSLSKYLSVR